MYNLKNFNGTFKGIVGECMFKFTNKNLILPRFFGKEKYLKILEKYLNINQKEFLKKNWFSIDAIELSFKLTKEIILYEVKTKNKYKRELFFKPKMTLATHQLLNKAKNLGFVVKLVYVSLHNDWDFTIKFLDFDEKHYCIDKPKRYDKNPGYCY